MAGVDRTNGQRLEGLAHIRQSVADILTTPLGSRVMRRDYGSLLPELIDQPLHDATLLQAYAASIMALIRWEPRLRVTAIHRDISTSEPGQVVLEIVGITTDGDNVTLETPLS